MSVVFTDNTLHFYVNTHGFSAKVVTKNQHKFGSATEESVLPPKTNNKNGIGIMNFISVSPLLPLCIPSTPTRRAEKGQQYAKIKIHSLFL